MAKEIPPYLKAFSEHESVYGLDYFDSMGKDEVESLGQRLFRHVDAQVRAEAMVECQEFDNCSATMFEDFDDFEKYINGVLNWMARAHSEEWDDYVREMLYEAQSDTDY